MATWGWGWGWLKAGERQSCFNKWSFDDPSLDTIYFDSKHFSNPITKVFYYPVMVYNFFNLPPPNNSALDNSFYSSLKYIFCHNWDHLYPL